MKKTIVQIEFRQSTLELREDILRELGHPVLSLLGGDNARKAELRDVGVVIIGHGAPREKRSDLIKYFSARLAGVPVITLLRRSDEPFPQPAMNCRADDPIDWVCESSKCAGNHPLGFGTPNTEVLTKPNFGVRRELES